MQVAGWFYVPLSQLGEDVAKVRERLTVHRRAGRPNDPKPAPLLMYDDSRAGFLGVPIQWGMLTYGHLSPEDCTSEGRAIEPTPCIPDPYHPMASAGQPQFIADLINACQTHFAVLAKAGTGTGKTVSVLYMAATLRVNTLVVVPTDAIARQWVAEAEKHLGLPPERIGVIKGPKCQWDRDIVIASIKTLVSRGLPEEAANAFGLAVWDEVHRAGAETFVQTLGMVNAGMKLALTATDYRKDGAFKAITMYFGKTLVEATVPALPCEVRVLTHQGPDYHVMSREFLVSRLPLDEIRNQKILKLVAKCWEAGRYILVLGESIKHLQALRFALVRHYGVPLEHTGQFTASYYPELPSRGPQELPRFEDKSKKMPSEALDKIKTDEQVSVIFATYGSFKEGVDIPRLDVGIDVSPRADGNQALGRIRRPFANKPLPIWYTVVDTQIPLFVQFARSRIKDYLKSGNVEILGYDKIPKSTGP